MVRIEVADDGIGIADANKIRLFEPNFSTKMSGMGLGLTIVNSIVTDHNGVIRVQDNIPKGTPRLKISVVHRASNFLFPGKSTTSYVCMPGALHLQHPANIQAGWSFQLRERFPFRRSA
jgi:signal transduction histidine kinase